MTRHIEFTGLHNFRDVGGYRAADGRTVRWGRLYRSDSLSKLQGTDWERFRALDVRTVIDLRYPFEIAARGRVPDGVHAYHNLSIEHRPYDQPSLGPDVETASYLAERYAEVVLDGTAEIRRVLELIAHGDNAPVVVHCASGKDRTGIVAALVLTALGVSDEDIVADFALTGLATARLVADWTSEHPQRTSWWPGYGQAPAELMRLFLRYLAIQYGSAWQYVTEVLGSEHIEAMRGHLLA